MQNQPIDAIIAWVDGDDPVLSKKRNGYIEHKGLRGAEATRFASKDEIVFCVLSILKYAPFFRNIFIVTDNQIPPIFDIVKKYYPEKIDKIKIIDHTEIFAGDEECLPTFNSISIEMKLHRIPELADHYVYFNDDFFLLRNVTPEVFFKENKPILRGRWLPQMLLWKLKIKNVVYALKGLPMDKRPFGGIPPQIISAQLANNQGRVYISSHVPHPMRRKTMADFEQNNTELIKKNISYRFRNISQFVTVALVNHIEIKNGNAFIGCSDERACVYIVAGKNKLSRILRRLDRADQNESMKFICIQSLDQAPQQQYKVLVEWLTDRFIRVESRA